MTNGVTFSQEISGFTIPADWTKVRMTVKSNKKAQTDPQAEIQIVESNPGVASDGILYYMGEAGGSNKTLGTLTVNQADGKIRIDFSSSLDLRPLVNRTMFYDLKVTSTAAGDTMLQDEAAFTVELTERRTVG